jgi:hypothetical protein
MAKFRFLFSKQAKDAFSEKQLDCVHKLMVEDAERYYLSLGQFVTIFSEIESDLQAALWHLADVPSPTAQAVFTGLRVNTLISYINRIADAQKWSKERKREFEYVFSQLGMINKLRNELLHYGSQLEGPDKWLVTNEFFAHTPEKVQPTRLSPAILDAATHDLGKIGAHIFLWVGGETILSHVSNEQRDAFLEVLNSAWLYKQPQRGQRPRKSRKTPPKRKRQHPASRG